MSEWKPGDVVVLDLGENGPSFLSANLRKAAAEHEEVGWARTAESLRGLASQVESNARPLVVIDPEDREQVAHLLAAYSAQVRAPYRGEDEPDDWRTDRLQAALREFASPTPPKPEEPQGLGAVVEDADGSILTKVSCEDEHRWATRYGVLFAWPEVDPVRVLSDGIRP